jgi:glycosyltransferase involved in cell wall biosynthesis
VTMKLEIQESNRPLLSFVVAALNNDKTIQRCIDSVSCQTYRNVELLIMDGGSTDGTVGILERNASRIAYWESKRDKGIYNAWNKALDHVRGEWIVFLGADDFLWSSEAVEKLVPHLARVGEHTGIIYCQVAIVNKEGNTVAILGEPWQKIKRKFAQVMCLPHQATVCHKNMFEKHGKFDESLRIAGDFDFLLRVLKHSDAVFVPDLILTGMQYGGISSNPANSFTVLKEIRMVHKKHGKSIPGMYWITAYARTAIRLSLGNLVGKDRTSRILDLSRRCLGKKPFWTRT